MKKVYLELLRILAIIFVLFNHTRSLGYSLYANTENPFSYWGSLSLSILCKAAVPIFFMVSGGVLLGRQETLKDLFRKRVLRFLNVILLHFFSISGLSASIRRTVFRSEHGCCIVTAEIS